jgi:glutaredoxin-like protein NrdH
MGVFGKKIVEMAENLGILKKEAPVDSEPLTDIPFVQMQGRNPRLPLTLFGLSTCGFCKKGIQYLIDANIAFRYVYVDKASEEVRKTVREYAKNTFSANLSYPFLCIGTERYLSGFVRPAWEKELQDV